MGQKVNPHGFRVGVIKDWDSRWYASEEKVGDLIVEDQKIRKYRNVFPPPGLNYLSPIHIIKTENIRWNGRLIPVPYWSLRKI